ncbi:MAG: toxin-antitoxin system HicB family antitoxin [Phycisphaerales bacterium]
MSTMSIRLPNSLHARARDLAQREGVSLNQLIATALAEKMSALMTVEILEERAGRGKRSRFLAALAKVPDREPEEFDRLPATHGATTTSKRRSRSSRPARQRRGAG